MQILTNKTSCAPFPDQACSGQYTARLSSESGSGSWARYHFSILSLIQDISQGWPKSLFDKIPPFRRTITSPFNVDYAIIGCLGKSSSHILGLVIIFLSGSSELRLLATNDDTKHVAAKTTLKVTPTIQVTLLLQSNHKFGAGYVGSILLTWSDDIKHTWDDSRSQALLFIWHHYTTLYILCCGVDLIKWNCLFHQSPEDTLMFSPDWTGHQTYFVSLRPPSAAASSNFRQMCSNLSFQDIFSLEKSPSFTARLYMYSFFLI